jgi:hypothetical protein
VDVNKFLLGTDSEVWTVFHVAAYFSILEVFQGIFNLAKYNLTRNEVCKLLSATNYIGWTVFYMAGTSSKLEVFQGIFNLAKMNLTTEEVNKFLIATVSREEFSCIWQHISLHLRYFREYLIWLKRILRQWR